MNDVAVVKLDRKANLNLYVFPICLANSYNGVSPVEELTVQALSITLQDISNVAGEQGGVRRQGSDRGAGLTGRAVVTGGISGSLEGWKVAFGLSAVPGLHEQLGSSVGPPMLGSLWVGALSFGWFLDLRIRYSLW